MKPVTQVFAILLCLFTVRVSVVSGQEPSETRPQTFPRVTIPDSQVRTIRSTSTGRDYDLYIHLPSDYEQDKNTKYPVLYLHDGQACFDAMTSYSGEFEADEAADQLIRAKKIPPIIMVGIDNNPDRSNEMTPTFDATFPAPTSMFIAANRRSMSFTSKSTR